jgi:hypothetical protein
MTALYERDFYAWTQEQAALLRNEEYAELDLSNLIEEIEAMGRRDRRELTSRLTVLLMHLLKWQHQTGQHGRSRSWQNTIDTQRAEIELILRDSPSLHSELEEHIEYAWPKACRAAARETRLPLSIFPTTCTYTSEQILDADWLP